MFVDKFDIENWFEISVLGEQIYLGNLGVMRQVENFSKILGRLENLFILETIERLTTGSEALNRIR